MLALSFAPLLLLVEVRADPRLVLSLLLRNPVEQLLGDLINDILRCYVLSSCFSVKPQRVALDWGPTSVAEPGEAPSVQDGKP